MQTGPRVEGKHVQRSWGSPMPGALEGQQGIRCTGAECTGVRELEEVRTGRQQDLVGHGEESGRVKRPQGVHWLRSPSRAAMSVQVVPWGHGMAPKSINPVGVGAVGRSRLVLIAGERCWAHGPRWAGQAARDCPGPSPSWLPASAGRAMPAPDPIRPGSREQSRLPAAPPVAPRGPHSLQVSNARVGPELGVWSGAAWGPLFTHPLCPLPAA